MAAWTEFYRRTKPLTWYQAGSPHGYAVQGIKREIKYLGFALDKFDPEALTIGAQAERLIKEAQATYGLFVDGVVGPNTAKALFKTRITEVELLHGIPYHYLCKLLSLESGFDPGATGSTDPRDRGLAQINSHWHPDVTDAEAFDPVFAINWTAEGLRTAYNYLRDWEGAIAAHNVGLGTARIWLKAGKPAGTAATYVELVKAQSC